MDIESLKGRGVMFRALTAYVRKLEKYHIADHSLLVGLAEVDISSSLSPLVVGSPNLVYARRVLRVTTFVFLARHRCSCCQWLASRGARLGSFSNAFASKVTNASLR